MKFGLGLAIALAAIAWGGGALGFGRIATMATVVLVALVAMVAKFLWNVAANNFEKHQWH